MKKSVKFLKNVEIIIKCQLLNAFLRTFFMYFFWFLTNFDILLLVVKHFFKEIVTKNMFLLYNKTPKIHKKSLILTRFICIIFVFGWHTLMFCRLCKKQMWKTLKTSKMNAYGVRGDSFSNRCLNNFFLACLNFLNIFTFKKQMFRL